MRSRLDLAEFESSLRVHSALCHVPLLRVPGLGSSLHSGGTSASIQAFAHDTSAENPFPEQVTWVN